MPGAGRTEPMPGRGICAGPVGRAGMAGRVAAIPAFGREGRAGFGRCIDPTFGRSKLGCGDVCPFYPGKRYEDWVLDDPAGQGIESVRVIRDEIKNRVEVLLAELLK